MRSHEKMSSVNSRIWILWVSLIVVAGATFGLFLMPKGKPLTIDIGSPLDPNLGVQDADAANRLQLRKQVDHPVTTEMIDVAATFSTKKAPNAELQDEKGNRVSLKSLTEGKPALLFFIEKQCPCCLGAKYFVEDLHRLHSGSAVVLGIINASGEEAAKWRKATKVSFPILEDPDQKAIAAFGAERGVYTTIVRPDGTIEKAYPGYSSESLDEMSRTLSRLANRPEIPYSNKKAPERLTSGCLFPTPPTHQETKK